MMSGRETGGAGATHRAGLQGATGQTPAGFTGAATDSPFLTHTHDLRRLNVRPALPRSPALTIRLRKRTWSQEAGETKPELSAFALTHRQPS